MPLLDPSVFRAVVDDLTMGVYFVDRDRRIVYWNNGAEKITGYLSQEVVGRCCRDNILVHCDEHNNILCELNCPLSETMLDGRPREVSVFMKHKGGYRVPIRIYAAPIRDENGEIIGAAETFYQQRFVPKPDRRRTPLVACGAVDELTGLPDHGYTLSVLKEKLESFKQNFADIGILAIQPDNLEDHRTKRGREAVDGILRVVTETLQNTLRPSDHLGRWSEDQFLVILPHCGGKSIDHVADRIMTVLRSCGIVWWGDPLSITASIGATIARPGDTLELIMARTERALQMSIDNGGNCVSVLHE